MQIRGRRPEEKAYRQRPDIKAKKLLSDRRSYKKGLLGSHVCRVKAHQLPEAYMRPIVIRALEDAAIDPKVLAAQKAAAAERRRLCVLGPWKRRLESNPGLQAWAKANLALAEAQKKKFLSDPKNQTSC